MRRALRSPWILGLLAVVLGLGAGGGSSAAAGRATWDLTGIWVGQDSGIYEIRQAGSTVTWYAHSPDGKTWAHDFKGTLKGNYVVGYFKDRPGYTNHFQGNLVVQVVNNDHLVWVPSYGGVTSVAILTRAWTRETSVAAAKLPTFTAVVCNIEVSSTGSTCAAEVADRSPQRSIPPTGTVTFSALSGTIGKSCALAGTPGSPGIASCTVSYTPSANLVQGEPPPVAANYAGDATFAPSSGGSSYKPASVLVPTTVTVDLTSSSGTGGASSEGIPNDLSNQNTFAVSADEQLTVPGNTDTTLIRAGTKNVVASRPKVIGHASFHLSPLTSVAATVKLTTNGRALLRKHKLLHAVLAVTTHAPGKPTKTITHRLTIKAR